MHRRAIGALLVTVLLGGLLWLYLGKVFLIQRLQRELAGLEKRAQELEAEIGRLRYMLAQIDELQELAIRTKLHYGLPGELVVLFGEGR